MFEQIKKEYKETPAQFTMHLIGTAAVIFEIVTFLLHGGIRVESPPETSPTVVNLLGIRVVLKLCAVLFIQWIIAKGQAWAQIGVTKSSTPLSYIVLFVIALLAAWLTLVNLHWMFFPSGLPFASPMSFSILVGLIAAILAIALHVFVLVTEFDLAAEANAGTAGFDKDSFDNMTGFGYVTYFGGLLFVVLSTYVT